MQIFYIQRRVVNLVYQNIIQKKKAKINIIELINNKNSCRYDCLITIFGFYTKPIIENNNIQYNEYNTIQNKTFEDLLDNPKSNYRFILYFSEK